MKRLSGPYSAAALTCGAAASGQRYYGIGFTTGSAADQVLPNPLLNLDAAVCAAMCSSVPTCKAYVHSGGTCWRSVGDQALHFPC
jgi:hypothetical protein